MNRRELFWTLIESGFGGLNGLVVGLLLANDSPEIVGLTTIVFIQLYLIGFNTLLDFKGKLE